MRYLLVIVGLGAMAIGSVNWLINWNESEAHLAPFRLLILAGAVAASVGIAAVEIISTINRSRNDVLAAIRHSANSTSDHDRPDRRA